MKIKRGGKEEESNKSQIEFTIKDTCVGISPDIQPRLFSKFATFSPGGTRLGLYISKNIVEAHGEKCGPRITKVVSDNKGLNFLDSSSMTRTILYFLKIIDLH
jgi:K+-sensing histidine kinase KdpD